ncbi:MAG: cytochrome c3 family protein [Deltaproteobacteria bacterium]
MLIQRYLVTAVALVTLIAGVAIKNGAAGQNNSIAPQKEITIEGKKPARFDHQKHLALGMKCAVCHHDKDHNGLTAEAIKAMADTKSLQCVSCHNSNFAKADLQTEKEVFHARCRECHKTGYNGKTGPKNCSACHIKVKKKLEGC